MDQKPFVRVTYFAYSPAESIYYGRCELQNVWMGNKAGWGEIVRVFPIGIYVREA